MTTSDPQNHQKNISFEEWTEFENFDQNTFHVVTELIYKNGEDEENQKINVNKLRFKKKI